MMMMVSASFQIMSLYGNKEILQWEHRLEHRLLDQELHEGFERSSVRLDPVGPRVALEHVVDLVQVSGKPGQHVAKSTQVAHPLVGNLLRFAQRVEKRLFDPIRGS